MKPNNDVNLTEEQIENWRKVLCTTLGPYALTAPREVIQRIRNNLQTGVNKLCEQEMLNDETETIT